MLRAPIDFGARLRGARTTSLWDPSPGGGGGGDHLSVGVWIFGETLV